jgi:hypothetical protein
MEASFESVCDSVSWKADRKLACGLVKIKNHYSQGPQALLLDCFLVFENAVYTLIRIDPKKGLISLQFILLFDPLVY